MENHYTVAAARVGEMPALWPLLTAAVGEMNRGGNPQWDGDYPAQVHYLEALAAGELYFAWLGDTLVGAVVLNSVEEPAYATVPWGHKGTPLVIHKLVVDPQRRGCGVGATLLEFGGELARWQGLGTLRVDTYSLNAPMQRLLAKSGFIQRGEVHFPRLPLPYPCFDKSTVG